MGTAGAVSAQGETRAGSEVSREKIDMYCHILTPKYKEALFEIMPRTSYYWDADSIRPALFELDVRLKMMDQTPGLREVLTPGAPPLEYVASPKQAVDMARMANDEMAEVVARYPDRFVAGVACLPLNDVDASIREAERAFKRPESKRYSGFLVDQRQTFRLARVSGPVRNNGETRSAYLDSSYKRQAYSGLSQRRDVKVLFVSRLFMALRNDAGHGAPCL